MEPAEDLDREADDARTTQEDAERREAELREAADRQREADDAASRAHED